ncbi:aminoglycoside phosphotransferase family protein [Alkalibacillus haloalkaliphilus]|uniref:aminoglycoside phosphotransferase family protein n=1 Tax=Alkalibacillus haloalkaliphilus TaxID=94136 RepID=UPI00030FE6F7|nr:aminoglycoside phosphotransferase family protein [Alkalibacillus haloalkaliphilus]
MEKLQGLFVKSVNHYFPDEGEAWLRKLPDLINYCEQKWSITVKKPYSLSINYVAPAVTRMGKELVVKICIPGEGFMNELEALQLFEGKGMVQLVDWDEDYGLFLLEKINPGTYLVDVLEDEEACEIAADVINKLHKEPPKQTRFIPTVTSREQNFKRIVEKNPNGLGPISRDELRLALTIFSYLNKTTKKQYLLHGDFHHYNVLKSVNGNWIAI